MTGSWSGGSADGPAQSLAGAGAGGPADGLVGMDSVVDTDRAVGAGAGGADRVVETDSAVDTDSAVGAGAGGAAARENHVAVNETYWDGQAEAYAEPGRRLWASAEPRWGVWGLPQSQVPLLPDGVAGLDVVELGCGTAYVSSWLARRGARPVGVDLSSAQLATARDLQEEHGVRFPLVRANAERLPLADGSFDLAVSEYGAVIWCEPRRWIAEAARVLRPGGRLIFLRNADLMTLCERETGPTTDRLQRPLFGLERLEWDDPEGRSVEFHLPHGALIDVLVGNGFAVEKLLEVQVPADARTGFPYVTAEWAHQWPSEEVWYCRKVG